MPGKDGTGPWGTGAGMGGRRGFCRGFGWGRSVSNEEELETLKKEKSALDTRIAELEKTKQ